MLRQGYISHCLVQFYHKMLRDAGLLTDPFAQENGADSFCHGAQTADDGQSGNNRGEGMAKPPCSRCRAVSYVIQYSVIPGSDQN